MSSPRAVRSRKDQPPTPRARPRKDGTIGYQVRYRIPRPGSPDPVATSQVFDGIESATRWAELLHRVGPVAAEAILAAQIGAGTSKVPTLVEWCRHYVDKLSGGNEETKKKSHRYIDRDIAPFFGAALPVDALTTEMDTVWLIHLQ